MVGMEEPYIDETFIDEYMRSDSNSKSTDSGVSSIDHSAVVLEEIAPVIQVTEDEATPFVMSDTSDIFRAVEVGDLGRVHSLNSEGILLSQLDQDGRTLLHVACRHLWYEIIHFLLGKNCDVNAKSLDGSTPLHSAVQSPYLKLRGLQCVRLLLTFGANPNLMDSRNNKPRDLISANSNDDNSYLLEIMNLIASTEIRKNNQAITEKVKVNVESEFQKSLNNSLDVIRYDVDDNKILIQDLKSSVITLKVAISRIEKEAKELSSTVDSLTKDKKHLENTLIDLDFRFNELVAKEEDENVDENHNMIAIEQVDGRDREEEVRNTINQLEIELQRLSVKTNQIDAQQARIVKLGESITEHESVVKDIQTTLSYHEKELIKLDELQLLAEWNAEKQAGQANGIINNAEDEQFVPEVAAHQERRCSPNGADGGLVNDREDDMRMPLEVGAIDRPDEFLARMLQIEKSVATAWVGLVAALLLIPIAYIMGKWF